MPSSRRVGRGRIYIATGRMSGLRTHGTRLSNSRCFHGSWRGRGRLGDGSYAAYEETDQVRTHNAANEVLTLRVDEDGDGIFTGGGDALREPVFDPAGQLTDDAQRYEYTYSVWGWPVEVSHRGTTDLAKVYRHNALGQIVKATAYQMTVLNGNQPLEPGRDGERSKVALLSTCCDPKRERPPGDHGRSSGRPGSGDRGERREGAHGGTPPRRAETPERFSEPAPRAAGPPGLAEPASCAAPP